MSLQWQPLDSWRLTASYSYIQLAFDDESLTDTPPPSQQASLRSYVNLRRGLELNTAAYYVGAINAPLATGTQEIPSYVRVDTGMTWRASAALEMGMWVQNLLDRRHAEMTSFSTPMLTEVPRSFLARMSWHF